METQPFLEQLDNIEIGVQLLLERCQTLESANRELQETVNTLQEKLNAQIQISQKTSEDQSQLEERLQGISSSLSQFLE